MQKIEQRKSENTEKININDYKNLAFIDLLIDRHLNPDPESEEKNLQIEDIREEVDTFMFEGMYIVHKCTYYICKNIYVILIWFYK